MNQGEYEKLKGCDMLYERPLYQNEMFALFTERSGCRGFNSSSMIDAAGGGPWGRNIRFIDL